MKKIYSCNYDDQNWALFCNDTDYFVSVEGKSQYVNFVEFCIKLNDKQYLDFYRAFVSLNPEACFEMWKTLNQVETQRHDLKNITKIKELYPDVNLPKPEGYGRTPLMMESTKEDNYNIIKSLLKLQADVNPLDNWGDSALSLALKCRYSCNSTIKLLIENKADVNIQPNRSGSLPFLINLCIKKKFNLIPTALDYGADVHFKTKSNKNALHFICAIKINAQDFYQKKCKLNTIYTLLLAGADYQLRNKKHKEPLDLLESTEKKAINTFIGSEIKQYQIDIPSIILKIPGMYDFATFIPLITGYLSWFAQPWKPAHETNKPIECRDLSTSTASLVSQSMVASTSTTSRSSSSLKSNFKALTCASASRK